MKNRDDEMRGLRAVVDWLEAQPRTTSEISARCEQQAAATGGEAAWYERHARGVLAKRHREGSALTA